MAGGGAHRVFEIYRRLTDRVDVTVASGNYPGARAGLVDGVRYVRLGSARPYSWSRLTYARAASRLLALGDFDVGMIDFSVYSPVRLPPLDRVGMVVHMLHGPTARDRFGPVAGSLVRAAEKRALRKVAWVTTTSRWLQEQLKPLLRADARVKLISSGVAEEFRTVRRHERDFVLYYGRFDVYQKGIDTLLDAFAGLAGEFPKLRLVLAGQGKDAERLAEMARARAIGQRVEIRIGVERKEVLELMSGALVLAMPSRLEGLPTVPIEAMAAGIPVIATDVGAVSEVVTPPAGGMLVPPDDPAALRQAIQVMLRDSLMRSTTSATARLASLRFDWQAVAERHLDFLQAMAGYVSSRGEPASSELLGPE